MTIPGLALRSVLMCLRAWRAYCCPGPGSSDAIRLIAACASVKMVTRSGVCFFWTRTPVCGRGRRTPRRRLLGCIPCGVSYPQGARRKRLVFVKNIRVIGCVGTPLLDHVTIARTALYIYMQKKAHYPSPTHPDALGRNLSPPV